MNYYEDFYEPSEFDSLVEEFKDELRKSIKEEHQTQIKDLKNRITQLEEFRVAKRDYERKIERLEHELEQVKKDALYEAKRIRIANVLNDVAQPAWKVTYERVFIKEKCDKCDENRKIHFQSPSGRELTEDCECSKTKLVYKPQPAKCVRFYTDNNKVSEKDFIGWIETRKETNNLGGRWERLGDSNYAWVKYAGESFDKLSRYSVYFFNEEECQAYCDWLNERELNQNK